MSIYAGSKIACVPVLFGAHYFPHPDIRQRSRHPVHHGRSTPPSVEGVSSIGCCLCFLCARVFPPCHAIKGDHLLCFCCFFLTPTGAHLCCSRPSSPSVHTATPTVMRVRATTNRKAGRTARAILRLCLLPSPTRSLLKRSRMRWGSINLSAC